MGLDISHGTWHGAYSAFMTWREKVAELAGLPPLQLMQGFYDPLENPRLLPTLYYRARPGEETPHGLKKLDQQLPILWDCLKPSPLHELLYHSDCSGSIRYGRCKKIADELEKLLPAMKDLPDQGGHIGNWLDKTTTFIAGLRLANSKKEGLKFR